jgi:hypothetical protein
LEQITASISEFEPVIVKNICQCVTFSGNCSSTLQQAMFNAQKTFFKKKINSMSWHEFFPAAKEFTGKKGVDLDSLPDLEFQHINLANLSQVGNVFTEYLNFFSLKNLQNEAISNQKITTVAENLLLIQVRIMLGALFVACSKYYAEKIEYQKLVASNSREAIYQKLTRANVERKISERINSYAETYCDSHAFHQKIQDFFMQVIIEKTKHAQVELIFQFGAEPSSL